MTLTAVHKVTGTRIVMAPDQDLRADYAEWDQLICPISNLPVIPRRAHARKHGAINVRAHFALKGSKEEHLWPDDTEFDIEYGQIRNERRMVGGESWEHREAKQWVANQWSEAESLHGAQIDFEKRIQLESGRWRIADILIRYPSGLQEVHEVQLKPISADEIQQRTDDYMSVGIAPYWWVGGGCADCDDVRDLLRSEQGGFFQFRFQEVVPDGVETESTDSCTF